MNRFEAEQKCILFRDPFGRLGYSTYSTDMDSESIQKDLIDRSFIVIGSVMMNEAVRLTKQESQGEEKNTNFRGRETIIRTIFKKFSHNLNN